MLKLLIFALTMLALSGICNGQGKTAFGDNAVNDTSFTVAQLKLNAYGGSGDTMQLVVLPNGDVKKVVKGSFGAAFVKYTDTAAMLAPYLRAFSPSRNISVADIDGNGSLSIDGNAEFQGNVEITNIGTQEDAIVTVDGSGFLGKSIITTNDIVNWDDTLVAPGIATKYDLSQVGTTPSNESIQKSASPTNTAPSQAASKRYTDLAASTRVSFPTVPYVWWIVDTPWVALTSGLIDTFRDASGNNRTAYQTTTANKATWSASGGMNNNPYASFHSTSANPAKYNSATVTLDTTYTLFFVFKMNENINTTGEFVLGTSATSTLNVGQNFIDVFLGGGQEHAINCGNYNYVIYEVQRKGRVVTQFANNSKGGANYNAATTATFNWSGIGGNIGSGAQFPAFIFHELIAYNSVLSEEQMQNVRNYLYGKYGGRYGTIFAFGDSWTEGVVGTQFNGLRWSSRLAATLGWGEINLGLGGTVLENIGAGLASNGYIRRLRQPYPSFSGKGYAIVMYGGNDANSGNPSINLTTYNPITYGFQLSTVVNALLDYGWKRDQIILSTQGRFTGALRPRWDSFMTTQLRVARQMNVRSLDLNTYFGDNIANNGSIGGDGTHPTATQNDTIARLMQSVIMTEYVPSSADTTSASVYYPVPNQKPAVFIGSTSTWTLPPVVDNKGYSISISNVGTGNITVNTFAGGNDLFTTVATNTITIAAGDNYILFNTGTYWKTQKSDP